MDRICSTMKQEILLMEAWDMKIKHTLNKDFRSRIFRTFNRQIYIVNFQVLIIYNLIAYYLAPEILFLGIIVIILHIDVQWNTIWAILFQKILFVFLQSCHRICTWLEERELGGDFLGVPNPMTLPYLRQAKWKCIWWILMINLLTILACIKIYSTNIYNMHEINEKWIWNTHFQTYVLSM